MKAELGARSPRPIPLPNPNIFSTPQESISGTLKGCLGNLDGSCIEKLLLHCASALENNDVTLAQQVMWVLNNFASSSGDTNQRLTSWFLRALITRASRVFPGAMNIHGTSSITTLRRTRLMTVTELAGCVDLIPWHRFGFCASNSAIYRAIEGHSKVHILDFSITHCMQWPTLIDELAKRPEGAPSVRITVPYTRPPITPFLTVSIQEVGLRLKKFAKSRDVPFEFHVIKGSSSSSSTEFGDVWEEDPSYFFHEFILSQLNPSLLDLRDDEALVVNCQNWLRYLPDDQQRGKNSAHSDQDLSCKDGFLEIIRELNPCILTVVDEDSDLDSPSLGSRITTCFNYLWIPFDALETILPKDSWQRLEYEADVGQKIENIIVFEGPQRIERPESCANLAQRMKQTGFHGVPFCEETVKEVKFLLDEHASGWGMKTEDDMLVLTWKGHNSVFSSAWVPSRFDEYKGLSFGGVQGSKPGD